ELVRLMKASAASAAVATLLLPGMLGMVGSFLAGLVALAWLSSWLEKGRWQYFGYYCVVFSAVVFAASYLL
ncbi:MAG TPA: undecaprenyl-diphosphate phosphatase, partial [Candidatus Sulfotelmatobacter sp.]|nr:undecaprenyl-diphosphate phosphatase [Candidatus Sulfotelmatobacter sp.]